MKKLTATQALTTLAGNKRLLTYVDKKFKKETKTLGEWKEVFDRDGIK